MPSRRRKLITGAACLLASIAVDLARAAPHTVAPGETLYRIATTYGTTVAELQALNHLSGTDIKVGQVLVVPDSAAQQAKVAPASKLAPAPTQHTVEPGETLYRIAVTYGVSLDELRAANALNSDALKPGQVLTIPGIAAQAPGKPAEIAAPKPSLPTAAPQVPPAPDGLKVPALGSWTPAPANIATAPVPGAALPDLGSPKPDANAQGNLILHTVAKGENLYRIGLRYGVSAAAVASANNLTDDSIAVGQTLRIPTAGSLPATPTANLDLTSIARRYLGVAYRYGGTSPSGLDCSGFTLVVMAEAGVKLPRTSGEQYNTGTPVDRASLQTGDLVFFDTVGKGSVSHVGIYLGEDRFIHAATLPPMVTENSLTENYYAARYLGARRVLPQTPVTASLDSNKARP